MTITSNLFDSLRILLSIQVSGGKHLHTDSFQARQLFIQNFYDL